MSVYRFGDGLPELDRDLSSRKDPPKERIVWTADGERIIVTKDGDCIGPGWITFKDGGTIWM
jgi:hypothetical protein